MTSRLVRFLQGPRRGARTLVGLGSCALVVGALVAAHPGPVSGQQSDGSVTFTRDVAPILQNKCQICHREGSIGPRPWTTFEEVRPLRSVDQGPGGQPADAALADGQDHWDPGIQERHLSK